MISVSHFGMFEEGTECLSLDDLCRLSRLFNATANLHIGTQDYRINEWLKKMIAEAERIEG